MKRAVFCFILLTAAVISAGLSPLFIKGKTQILIERIDSFEKICENANRRQDCESALQNLMNEFDGYYISLSYFIPDERLDEMSVCVSRLEGLLSEESEELFAELDTIRSQAYLVLESTVPRLFRVL